MAACCKGETDGVRRRKLIYRMAQNSLILKYSDVVTGMLRFKPANQSIERYDGFASCALNTKELISNNFWKFSN
jgi:hypothetical protein